MARLLSAVPRALSAACAKPHAARRAASDGLRSAVDLSADWYWETDDTHRVRILDYSPHYRVRHRDGLLGSCLWEAQVACGATTEGEAHRTRIARHEIFHRFEIPRLDAAGNVWHMQISGEPRTRSTEVIGRVAPGYGALSPPRAECDFPCSDQMGAEWPSIVGHEH